LPATHLHNVKTFIV